MSTSNAGALLDADSPDTIRMSVAEAQALGMLALQRIGYPEAEARIITDHLIDNALCGYRFAGLPRIIAIAEMDRTSAPRQPVKIVQETAVSARVDGGNNVGYIAALRGAEIAIEKARHCGLATVGVSNSYFSGRNAYYAEKIVNAGYVVMHSATAIPRVLPLGGKRPALGPNPICFGFPSAGGPVILDMGTASIMWGEVLLHAHLGKPLPEGVGFDAEGRPTRDAREAVRGGVVPFGGHRGYGLSFAIQSLGLLAGSALGPGKGTDFAFFFVVIDPKLLLAAGDFERQMSEFIAHLKATPRQPGVDEIRIPSERAFRERMLRRVQGIVVDRAVVETLRSY